MATYRSDRPKLKQIVLKSQVARDANGLPVEVSTLVRILGAWFLVKVPIANLPEEYNEDERIPVDCTLQGVSVRNPEDPSPSNEDITAYNGRIVQLTGNLKGVSGGSHDMIILPFYLLFDTKAVLLLHLPDDVYDPQEHEGRPETLKAYLKPFVSQGRHEDT